MLTAERKFNTARLHRLNLHRGYDATSANRSDRRLRRRALVLVEAGVGIFQARTLLPLHVHGTLNDLASQSRQEGELQLRGML